MKRRHTLARFIKETLKNIVKVRSPSRFIQTGNDPMPAAPTKLSVRILSKIVGSKSDVDTVGPASGFDVPLSDIIAE